MIVQIRSGYDMLGTVLLGHVRPGKFRLCHFRAG
jgi:hypothetical protein